LPVVKTPVGQPAGSANADIEKSSALEEIPKFDAGNKNDNFSFIKYSLCNEAGLFLIIFKWRAGFFKDLFWVIKKGSKNKKKLLYT
jgi:hypothetical protein